MSRDRSRLMIANYSCAQKHIGYICLFLVSVLTTPKKVRVRPVLRSGPGPILDILKHSAALGRIEVRGSGS